MIKFILRKIFYGFVVLLGVITAIFFLFNVLPGDPATILLGQRSNKEAVEAINKDLGRDKPIVTQYFIYLNDLSLISFHNENDKNSGFYLDKNKYSYTYLFSLGENDCVVMKAPYLRRSYITKRKVSEIIIDTLPETALLALSSIILATIVGVFLGIVAAIKKDTFFDRLALILSALGMSAPSFFVGVIIAWFFGYILADYTGLRTIGSLYEYDDYTGEKYLSLKNLILPTITLGMRPLAIVVQLMRSSLLDVLSQDYIRTAKAKGLTFYNIILKHALKNALNFISSHMIGGELL